MSNELVKYQWQDKEITLTKSDVRNLISTDPSVTDKEIQLFMELCRYQNLNPFVREAYLIKYGAKNAASMVVGKEVFTKRAEMNADFDGYDFTDNYKSGMDLNDFEVTCKVYRKNLKYPILVTVSYPEYVGTNSYGEINRMWKGKPRTMLRKVALMQCLREAFPTALGGLYEENELDQQAVPKDITPKSKVADMAFDPQNEGQVTEKEEEIIEKAMEQTQAEAIEGEERELGIENDRDREQVAMEDEEVKPADSKPASDKQKDYIYGTSTSKGIIESHLITKEEVKRIGLVEDLDIEKANKILAWWWGNKEKNIIGEREKREKNPKVGDSDLERRGVLMQEVLDLMKDNHIKPAERNKMYKKYQKEVIGQLAFEELTELKALLEHYTPDWK